jgi:hypothetical protein
MKVSTSTQTVLKEICPLYGLSPMLGAFLLKFSPDNDDNHNTKSLTGKMCDRLFNDGFLDFDFENWQFWECPLMLTEKARRFIGAVEARKETRVMLKHGCDLFPETANI